MNDQENDFGEYQFPANYLRCEKDIDGTWTTTGWAPNIEAAERHAVAVGGKVRVGLTDNVIEPVASYCNP